MTSLATLNPPVAKPAHVPDALVYDFDVFADPAYIADPHKRVWDLIENAPPIFWTPRNNGQWIILRYEANFNAARDTEFFSNELIPQAFIKEILASLPPGTPHIPQPTPVNVDPPEHGKYRQPLQRIFSPKAINALTDDIRVLADQLIDDVVTRGGCEFISAIAEPLPVQVFLKMMGLPLERQQEYRDLLKEYMADPLFAAERGIQRLHRITACMRDTVLARRENPRNDIISMLWSTEIDGKPMTLEDMENYGLMLFIAGLDTVLNGMGHGVRHLAMDLPLQQRLRANPQLIPAATEELLRRYSFVVPNRRVLKDTVFEGVQFKAEERVLLFLPAANLDAKAFLDPKKFDLEREDKTHITFNAGPHYCVGAHLARLELQTIYEQLLSRLPAFTLDPAQPPKFHGGYIASVDSLHLLWK